MPETPIAKANGCKAARLREVLAQSKQPLTSAELARFSGIPAKHVGRLLRYDIRKGRVLAMRDPLQPRRRHYELAP
jgi:hypothetical protein